MAAPATFTFDQLANAPDDAAIDLAVGAALIAKDVYDDLDVDALLKQLDELAGPLHGGALVGLPLMTQAEKVSARFRELGFHGNVDDYYDPKNSLLPDVLERRTEIPISLSLVWCEIARRAGVFARGVSFPGHFLVRIDELPALSGREPTAPIIVDPFNDARILTDVNVRAPQFEPATSRATLIRMLTNLKAIWAQRGERVHSFVVIERLAALTGSPKPASN